uniref:Zinc finger, CCHC-type, retrotransposon Gag domain protein n=1 Tax=Tanacetum cinerariifolium TaxID=118510 RepID=A0A699QJB5_TANCI|nr:zinc finger, CCHC-type, retrotransposon Gag domain protein [Tanacetum cinerariifolium]
MGRLQEVILSSVFPLSGAGALKEGRFLRLAGFLGAAAGTEEEQAKNFQWGLRKSTLNHLMCMPFTDVAQVANAARNYEILHERDDDDAERPDKRNSGNGRDQRNRGQ